MNTAAGVITPYRLQFAMNDSSVRRIIKNRDEEILRTWRKLRKRRKSEVARTGKKVRRHLETFFNCHPERSEAPAKRSRRTPAPPRSAGASLHFSRGLSDVAPTPLLLAAHPCAFSRPAAALPTPRRTSRSKARPRCRGTAPPAAPPRGAARRDDARLRPRGRP
jgi:hypothetical protein